MSLSYRRKQVMPRLAGHFRKCFARLESREANSVVCRKVFSFMLRSRDAPRRDIHGAFVSFASGVVDLLQPVCHPRQWPR